MRPSHGFANKICIIRFHRLVQAYTFTGEHIRTSSETGGNRKILVREVKDEVVGSVLCSSAGDFQFGLFIDYGMNSCLFGCLVQYFLNALLTHVGADIVCTASTESVSCDSRHTGIEIGFIACNALGTFRVN